MEKGLDVIVWLVNAAAIVFVTTEIIKMLF